MGPGVDRAQLVGEPVSTHWIDCVRPDPRAVPRRENP
jgi:hypothetical protein